MEDFKQKYPTIHKHLFTVTTFSKILAMILFITLPFLGFYLGMRYKEGTEIKPSVISTITPTPTSKTERFIDCTTDVKKCPDGSYVQRDAANDCKFNSCPNETQTLDTETANWKTYKNLEHKFLLKYPLTWRVTDINQEVGGIDVISFESGLGSMRIEIGYGGRGYEYLKKSINYDGIISNGHIQLNNRHEGINDDQEWLKTTGTLPKGYGIFVMGIKNGTDNYFFVFEGSNVENANTADKYLNKIINTMVFN
jgi:hypothetical protein